MFMATILLNGQRTWSCTRDDEGHREYKVTFRVRGSTFDGPANVLQTPGLPLPGSFWLIDNDIDVYAWCRPNATVEPEIEDEPNRFWSVEMTFSTKPPDSKNQRCQEVQIEDPLLEPQKVSGGMIKYTEEAYQDVFGRPLMNSCHEPLRGPQVEFDMNRPTVKIEQNVAILDLGLCTSMVDTVNRGPLWGLPSRTIKLSNFSWERLFYGQCYVYYKRVFEFDINYRGFDRVLLDEGTKVLKGHWDLTTEEWVLDEINGQDPNPKDPTHFMQMVDIKDNPIKIVLNGAGIPYKPFASNVGEYVDAGTQDYGESQPELESETDLIVAPSGLAVTEIDGGTLSTTSRYVVSAEDVFGNETLSSNIVTFTPSIPGSKSAKLTWNVVSGAAKYRIYKNAPVLGDDFFYYDSITNNPGNLPGRRVVVKYPESNFLLLGIPLTF